MSIKEYLYVLNNGEINKNMMTGFIDIEPGIGDIPYMGYSELELSVDSENITANKVYYTEYGDIPVSRTTPLNDDISLHCGEFASPDVLLQKTIDALIDSQDTIGNGVYDRVKYLRMALERIQQHGTGLKH